MLGSAVQIRPCPPFGGLQFRGRRDRVRAATSSRQRRDGRQAQTASADRLDGFIPQRRPSAAVHAVAAAATWASSERPRRGARVRPIQRPLTGDEGGTSLQSAINCSRRVFRNGKTLGPAPRADQSVHSIPRPAPRIVPGQPRRPRRAARSPPGRPARVRPDADEPGAARPRGELGHRAIDVQKDPRTAGPRRGARREGVPQLALRRGRFRGQESPAQAVHREAQPGA